jgi:nucleotide-binding universal stress UspA family protein
VADSIHPIPRGEEERALLGRGLTRLGQMGVPCGGAVVFGEPVMEIGARARSFNADLVIVGHRRQGLIERWWSGASGAYLVDNVSCSVLIARRIVSDEEFERRLKAPPKG